MNENANQAQNQPQDQSTKDQQTSPATAELLKTLDQLKAQNAQLLAEKDEAKKKAQEEAEAKKREELEKASDLRLVLDELEQPGDEEKTGKSNINKLTNAELLDVIVGSMEKFLGAKETLGKEEQAKSLEGLEKKLDATNRALGNILAETKIDQLSKKYPEFDQLREETAKNLDEYPGIPIEKAFKMARMDWLEKQPAPEETEAEYPSTPPAPGLGLPISRRGQERVAGADQRSDREPGQNRQHGTSGFRNIVSAGIDRVLANKRRQ
jgi:hypothetical protein